MYFALRYRERQVDNLCRNPDLVVLVPASQEAEPLEIQVTLHPYVPTSTPLPRRRESTVYRPLVVPQSPKLSTPASPPSITAPFLQVSQAPRPEDTAGNHYQGLVTGTEQQSSLVRTECIAEGQQHTPVHAESAAKLKRRDRLWLPSRRSRQQSNVGGGGRIRTAPVPSSPASSVEIAGAAREGLSSSVIGGAGPRRSGGSNGSGMFASLTRRSGGYRSWRQETSASTSRSTPHIPIARESPVDHACPGGEYSIREGDISQVRATSPPLFVEYTTDEGGQESGSSSEDDFADGRLRRKSYIRVACTARTCYKLFSSDPQVRSTRKRAVFI